MCLHEMSNEMLLQEIKSRFTERDLIINDSKVMLKNLEEVNKKLSKSEENRSKFMSIIKNEFNNPLFSMISLSKSLLKSSDDEKIQFIGSSLYEESLMLNFQIKNIITAAEIESGTIDIQTSKIDFSDIILQVKEELQYPIKNKKINLEIDVLSEADIYADREKIYLIILNLVSNAIEFSPANSIVVVEVVEEIDDFKIIVKDFGEGIAEGEKENIFKRFHQAHSGMNRAHRGQGIGLSVVQDLVELLNGVVKFQSQILKYTVFEISIPKSLSNEESLFDDDDFLFNTSDDGNGTF
nr:HAMP domain-containing sensor histidine kinase [uncultured Sulfurimonas sp.]